MDGAQRPRERCVLSALQHPPRRAERGAKRVATAALRARLAGDWVLRVVWRSRSLPRVNLRGLREGRP